LATFEPVNGNRHFEGRLINFENGRLTVDIEAVKRKGKKKGSAAEASGGLVEIELRNVEKANLVPEI
jgi:ribosome maturation factor RimP